MPVTVQWLRSSCSYLTCGIVAPRGQINRDTTNRQTDSRMNYAYAGEGGRAIMSDRADNHMTISYNPLI